jgi:hypothetical protein
MRDLFPGDVRQTDSYVNDRSCCCPVAAAVLRYEPYAASN